MLTKALFIGVGGSGGSTLQFLWQELDLRLKAAGWDNGIPSAWQFLHIDAPQLAEEGAGEGIDTLRDGEHYLGLAKNNVKYAEYAKLLESEARIMVGWRPDPSHEWGPIWKGAAQRRAIGRVITMANLGNVGERVGQAIRRMTSTEATAELNDLATTIGLTADGKATPLVGLISSLGGGAGAGMFLDISLLLRGLATPGNEFLNEHFNILYPADVFGSLPAQARVGISPNTLASLSELLSAHQHEGELDEDDVRVLDRAGAPLKVDKNRTAAVNFFMGSRNSQVQFSSMSEIYHATARGLAAFLTNPQIGEHLQNKVIINHNILYPPVELVGTSRRAENSEDLQAGTTFGYAAVSLGRSAFVEYVADIVGRRIVDQLMKQDDELEIKKVRSRGELEENARDFARRCQLLELDFDSERKNDQILDALRDARSLKRRVADLEGSIQTRLRENTALSKGWNGSQWVKSLNDEFDGARKTVQEENRAALRSAAHRWVSDVRSRVMTETMKSICEVGFPVTMFYLEQLVKDLTTARDQLKKDVSGRVTFQQASSSAASKIFNVLDKVEALTVDSERPKQFLANLRNFLTQDLERDTRELASELIEDFTVSFLRPMHQELTRSRSEFAAAFEELNTKYEFDSWSNKEVSRRLFPAPNERYVIDVQEFPREFVNLLKKLYVTEDEEAALGRAAQEVFGGFGPGGGNYPTLQFDLKGQVRMVESPFWIPRVVDAREDTSSVPTKAGFRLAFDLNSIREDARKWALTRMGALSEYTTQSLASYLNDRQAEDGAKRRSNFVNSLKLALSMAEPMVNFNPVALRYFHQGADESKIRSVPVIGKIPLSPSTKEGDDVKQLLIAAGIAAQDADTLLDPNASGSEVEIARFVMTFVHPVVMDSVMKPLAQEWGQNTTSAGSRKTFWECRRARTLPSFIPLARSVQVEMAKGWIVARMLDLVSNESIKNFCNSQGQKPIEIQTLNGVRRFPAHLLRPDYENPLVVFPMLMESFMVALLDVSTGDFEAFEAYKALGNLGRNARRILSDWVVDGIRFGASPTSASVENSSTEEERKAKIAEDLQLRAQDCQELEQMVVNEETFSSLDRSWEMRQITMAAITELQADLASGQKHYEVGRA